MRLRKLTTMIMVGTAMISIASAIPSRAHAADIPAPAPVSADRNGNPPNAPEKKHGMVALLPEVSLYYPTASKTRGRFGDSWNNIGLCLRLTGNSDAQDQVGLHISSLAQSNGDGHLRMTPIRLTYTHGLSAGKKLSPYVGVGASAVFLSLTSSPDNVRTGEHCLPSASLFAGVKFGSAGFAQASYNAMPSLKGFNLSGVGVSIGLSF